MPRTAEHIVACHKAACALRAAGKPIWKKEINIKAILDEDRGNESKEHIAAIAVRIAAMLRVKLPVSYFEFDSDDYDGDLAEVIEAMETCTTDDLAQDEVNGVEAVAMLKGWLEVVYDWADANRVWLGI